MMSEFISFIRKQGIMGLAIGFILGGAISKVVTALVDDIINPILGIVLGRVGSLSSAALTIGSVRILWGHFVGALIDFLVIALVVYYIFKGLGLDKLDKKE